MTQHQNNGKIALFPLSAVLFPQGELKLHIFENRYKEMFKFILSTGKHFGVVHSDDVLGGIAQIGCVATVTKQTEFPDGRLNIVTRGDKRFKIKELVQTDPFLIAEVEFLAETAVDGRTLLLAGELRSVIDDVLRLSSRVYGYAVSDKVEVPRDPVSLSYMVPSSYYGSLEEKQRMLSLSSAQERILEELIILDAARKHLAALSALQKAVG